WLKTLFGPGDAVEKASAGPEQAEHERTVAILNSLPDAVFVVGAKGAIDLANGAAQELMGNPPSWRQERFVEMLPLRPRTKPADKPVNVLEGGLSPQRRRDLRLTRADKTSVDLDLSVTPVQPDGGAAYYIVVARDITQER